MCNLSRSATERLTRAEALNRWPGREGEGAGDGRIGGGGGGRGVREVF